MIEFLGNKYTESLSMFDGIKAEHKDSKCKILVIDWWQDETLKIRMKPAGYITKIKEYDICFFMISEMWFNDGWDISPKEINSMLKELNKLNVFYITKSEDSRIRVDVSKSYDIPWFIRSDSRLTFHVDNNFKLDFDYRPKDYTFNMLLGSDTFLRTLFFELIGNEHYVYSTYFGNKKFKLKSAMHLEDDDILHKLSNQDITSNKLQTMSERVWRDWRDVSISHTIPEKIYNNSHFDIVTETEPLLNTLNFTTEKTGKPISTGRFFIWYNSPNQVEYLRQFGFELQDYLSYYDNVQCNVDRLSQVKELIKEIGDNENYIKKIYEDTKGARMYNQEVFKKLMRTYQSNITSWMSEQINTSYNSEKTNA
jgi:hypothetical protein